LATLRVCFVGDSFVNGTGDPEALGWCGRVCAAAQRSGHDITYYNLGVRRDTSTDIAARWNSEVTHRLPPGVEGRVVFALGVNDLVVEDGRERVGLDGFAANMRRMLREAASLYPTMVVGPPPVLLGEQGAGVASLNARTAELCAEAGVPFVDVLPVLMRSGTFAREAAANDGAHPRAAGYAELAAFVVESPPWNAWLAGS
jgi:lysophospholipase L1-like esterase